MPRPKRITKGNIVYHALNRANGRLRIFKGKIKGVRYFFACVSGYGNPYMYTARRFDDESGLYYYRNRHYSPGIKRFVQPDPIGYADGMNIYAYCGNSPVNYVDPLGLEKEGNVNYEDPLAYRARVYDDESFLYKGRNTWYNPLRHGLSWDFAYNDYAQ